MLRKNSYKDLDKYRKTRNSQKQRYYNKTKYARNRYCKWTKEEDMLVIQHSISDRELSQKIHRSMNAILVRRNRLKNKVIKENIKMEVLKYKRGQIWWYRTGDTYNGSIMGKTRPVIIMSNDLANKNSTCLLGIPCTTAEKKNMPTHTSFYLEGTLSTALAENMMSINKDKLGDYIGSVDDELLEKLEYNVKIALGFIDIPRKESEVNILSPTNPVPIENQDGFIRVDNKLFTNYVADKTFDNIPDVKIESKKIYKKMSEQDKHRFLNDYENHDKEYMFKKYGIKDAKGLQQKVYLIRKEFGLGVRNK